MKKTLPVLLILCITMIFSSCIFVGDLDELTKTTTNNHSIIVYNKSDMEITDWCVKKDGKKTFIKSEYCSPIPVDGHSTMSNLPEGTYVVYITYTDVSKPKPDDYVSTYDFELDEDTEIFIDKSYVSKYLNRYN